MLYIGCDLGTSSVKLILTDERGDIKNTVTKEYPISFPEEGFSEQDPKDWLEKTLEGLKDLVGDNGNDVRAISFGGQMHGLVMLDENDDVLRPAILWNDNRAASECEYLNNVIGTGRMISLTGNIAFPGFTAPKILWVKKHESEIFARCKKIMLPKDYLTYMLCGKFVTEPSDAAGTLLFDVKNGRWSEEMLDICSITPDILPDVRSSFEAVGTLKEEFADMIGGKDIIIAPGAGDNAAAAVGMGVAGEGRCSLSVGTSGTVFIPSCNFSPSDKSALHFFNHADGSYCYLGCILSAASCNKWWMEDVLETNDFEAEQKDIENLGDNSVFFLPYLTGERSPHNDPYARGVFAGLSASTKRHQMTQAVLEGVAYALRDSVDAARAEGIEINSACLCGGGAKSPLWRRILSNVLRLKLEMPRFTEGPAYGAAILAMVAAGEYATVNEACEKIVKMDDAVDFDEELAAKYDAGYERFKKLYQYIKPWFRE